MAEIQTELWPPSGPGKERRGEAASSGGNPETPGAPATPGASETPRLPPGDFWPASDIREFIASPRRPADYAAYLRNIFRDIRNLPPSGGLWDLLDYLERETDFYTAPASTRYHGAEPCGLVRHSLLVFANGIELCPVLLPEGAEQFSLSAACLFHDLCKVNMYESKPRNVKDEKTGEWRKEAFYMVRQDYISFGHGVESLLRMGKFFELPEPWKHAVRWHMGAYDMSPLDKFALEKALVRYREVLFLQTADLRAGVVEAV